MKVILFFLIVFSEIQSSAQVQEGAILYKVEVVDRGSSFSNASVDSLLQNVLFKVVFTKGKAFVMERYNSIRESKFIYNKNEGEVLSLETIQDRKRFTYSDVVDHDIRPDRSSGTVNFEFDSSRTKNILGYKCTRVVRELGDAGKVILWVTNEINPGVILPNSPLSMEYPALEFLVIRGQEVFRYMATEIDTVVNDVSVFEETIPDEYRLSVPTGRYVPGMTLGDTARVDGDVEFITYPFYPPGNDRLNERFRILPKELERPHYLACYAGYITFSVDKEGSIFEIEVPLTENEKMKKAIVEIIEKIPKWTPATVKGKTVNSFVTLMVMFPDTE